MFQALDELYFRGDQQHAVYLYFAAEQGHQAVGGVDVFGAQEVHRLGAGFGYPQAFYLYFPGGRKARPLYMDGALEHLLELVGHHGLQVGGLEHDAHRHQRGGGYAGGQDYRQEYYPGHYLLEEFHDCRYILAVLKIYAAAEKRPL